MNETWLAVVVAEVVAAAVFNFCFSHLHMVRLSQIPHLSLIQSAVDTYRSISNSALALFSFVSVGFLSLFCHPDVSEPQILLNLRPLGTLRPLRALETLRALGTLAVPMHVC